MTSISGPIASSQLTVFKNLFSAADNNKDRVISKDEAESARKKLPSSAKIAGSDLAKAFSALDVNRDNKLSASELAVLLAQQETSGGSGSNPPVTTTPTPPIPPKPTTPTPTPTPAPAPSGATASSAYRLKLLTDAAVDKNKDGAFSKDELETVRKGLEKPIGFAGSELATLFASADANKDKKLSLGEIKTFLALQAFEPAPPEKGAGTTPIVTNPSPTPGPGPIVTTPTPTPSAPSPSGQTGVAIPSPFPVTGPYKTDKLGAITLWGMAGEPQSAEKPYSLNVSDGILRIEAHQGDRRQKASEVNREIERAEVSFAANRFAFGQTYDVNFSMMFQGDVKSTADNDKFFQIHNTNDPGDASLGPIFAMQLEGDRMRIVTRSDPNATTTSRVKDNWIYEDTKNIERNTWYDFDIKIRVDPFGQGMVTVSRNGQEIANYEGPLGYNDKQPPYAKIGVYRDTSPETQVRLYKDMAFTPISS